MLTLSVMKKFNEALSRVLPGLLTGVGTAVVLYVANHVLHVPVLQSSVENALTPLAAVAAAAIVHGLAKPEQALTAEVAKIETQPESTPVAPTK